MNVQLSDDARRIIRSQIRRGRFASDAEVVEEALRLLDRQEPTPSPPPSEDDFGRQLIGRGLMSMLPDAAPDADDPDDQPVPVEGPPLSETVISERR